MNINYKSDFIVKVTFSQTLTAFKLIFKASGQRNYIAERTEDGTMTNCNVVGTETYIVFKDHHLGLGKLSYELVSWKTDAKFPTTQLVEVTPQISDVYLIDGASDSPTEAEVEALVNYAMVDCYMVALANGYQGTQEEYNTYLATLPEVCALSSSNNEAFESDEIQRQTAEEARQTAETARQQSEVQREASEIKRTNTESVRQNNESARQNSETTRQESETARTNAENVRSVSETQRVSDENARGTAEATRQANEQVRVSAENARNTAEQARASEFATLKQESEEATDNANHVPTIQNNTWWLWNTATQAYVDSGITAQGEKGDTGATGADGKTPILESGTTTTLASGNNATAELVEDGTDAQGNPKYKANFGIPKGADAVVTDATVVQTVDDSTTSVPSCKAVEDYVAVNGGGVEEEDVYKSLNNLNFCIYENTDGSVTKETLFALPTNYEKKFNGNMTVRKIYAIPNLSACTILSSFANGAKNLEYLSFEGLDVSKVTSAIYICHLANALSYLSFKNCNFAVLTQFMISGNTWMNNGGIVDLTGCLIPNVTNIQDAFGYSGVTEIRGVLDCTNVVKAGSVFGGYGNDNLTSFSGFSNIKVSYTICANYGNGHKKLTHDSLVSIISNLADMTVQENIDWATTNNVTATPTLTLGATNLAKLTEEEKAVATNKNWILA